MSAPRYVSEQTVRLGDVGRDGKLRFAALARYLQDAAHDDMHESGLDGAGTWVLRRVALDVTALAGFGERIRVETTCTGVGPRWAERITTVDGEHGARVEACAVWVFVDPATGRPAPLPDAFHVRFPVPPERTRVSTKLRHAFPPATVMRRPWPLRASDFDVMDHVNNAAFWEPVDEVLSTAERPPVCRAELEYRAAIEPGDAVVVEVDPARGDRPLRIWLRADGDVRGSAQVWFAPR